MNKRFAVMYKDRILEKVFNDLIKAGQWAYEEGYDPDKYTVVELLEDGEINHRAIIQVFDFEKGQGNYLFENHYTTNGLFHLPMEQFEEDKKKLKEKYSGDRYLFNAWIEY